MACSRAIVDRARDLEDWVEACRNIMKRKIRVFAFANNHYGGYAPDTLRLFEKLMETKGGQAVAGITGKRGEKSVRGEF